MKMNLMCPNWGMATLAGISHREGKTLCLDADIRKGGPRRPFAGRGCGLSPARGPAFPRAQLCAGPGRCLQRSV